MATKYRNGYRTAVSVGKDAAGKRQYLYFDGETADEADFLALEYKTKHKQKKRPQDITLGDAIDKFIKEKDAILSPSTKRGYNGLRKNAYSKLIDKKLSNISQSDIQECVNNLSKEMKPKTVHNAHGLISVVFKEYYPDFTLRTKLPQKVKPDIIVPTDAEIKKLVELSAETNMEIPILYAAFLSLRRSEICGIHIKDINLQEGTIEISAAVVANEHNKWVEKGTKTYSSKRIVYMPPAVTKITQKYIESKGLTKEDNLVNINPGQITKGMTKLCKQAGIDCTFHGLRHYFVSKLHASNVPDQYAIRMTGHKTMHMLKTVYQHIMTEKEKEIVQEIRDVFEGILK